MSDPYNMSTQGNYIPQSSQQNADSHGKHSLLDKTKLGGKAAFDKGWGWFEKLGAPVNKLTNKIGSEAFWPTTLDHESDKCARIVKSFCKDGFYKEQPQGRPVSGSGSVSPGPKKAPKVLVKIPQKVIKNCVGIAVFTVMRTGLWVSGAGGSGVLIAKKEDGSWSPPSGILIHTLGVGFMAGIDIYDCVLVINNREALNAFSKVRVSLGGEVSLAAGPLGIGGNVESELMKNRKPVWTYMKSRGLYGGIQFDGTIVVERNDENARFYGERLPISQILAGNVRRVPPETRTLMEVLKEAEGRTDVDQAILAEVHNQPPPSDVNVEAMTQPTAQQQQNFAPPVGYYAPEKTDYAHLGSEGYPPPPPQGQGSYPTHPTHGAYQPTDYPPPPPQPPRPTSSSHDPTQSQAGYAPPQAGYGQPHGGYEGQQGHNAYGAGSYGAPNSNYQPAAAPQGSNPQAPYFPPPPPH
ncbi:SH3 domain-containing YSC84 1 [Hyphodiscus hymeniophilus]|uniref:SH3 domain-containing YSC84 1 n=1 Tax=Hyphodiscus hymeniophilus TaxID=353542 RepID=A0A9P6SMJ4_9HELO|nr:SH3 domain-containing YSC84 1 [Hyphodiscus hymeniophilus]